MCSSDLTAAQKTDTTQVTPAPSVTDYPVQEMQITPENLQSYQDTLSDNFQGSQWQPGEGGDYTLTGDDGSTVTMHPDGTTSATEAPTENLLDAIGATETQPTAAQTTAQPTQTSAAQPTQTQAAPAQAAAEAAPKGLSVDQLQSLYSLFEGDAAAAAPQATEQAATGPQTYAPSEEANYLDALGKSPEYYKAIDPETLQMLQQIGRAHV